ncbi:tyrosine-type recombinase/integrase (plasmid) [Pontibacillus sp. ALD_SL1]|uniref:tyrosine-type recombinase/integrase n=1 Tax=Pontibacillus sp. ALD_SL1 TaxID=2777185 RepID=UPI001A957781|nr:tyrosine-type recombinase/integrase [Pontibacillus sp. ALD_SL1]QST02379.1 tyrosine-type recombinase/integrase [Pontibacillus sp. ALD_SL1]
MKLTQSNDLPALQQNLSSYLGDDGNPDLKEGNDHDLISLFYALTLENRSEPLSDQTLRAYKADGKTLLNFLSSSHLTFKELSFVHIQNYNAYVREHFSRRTAIRKLDFFKRILRFGYEANFYPKDLSVWVKKPKRIKGHMSSKGKEQRAEFRELSVEDAKSIIDALPALVQNPVLKKRNVLIGILLFTTGLRSSEIISLNWGSFRYTSQNEVVADVLGKGSKHRTIPIRQETVPYLKEYRSLLGKDPSLQPNDETPLFLASNHRHETRLSYDTLYKMIKRAVSLTDKNPHTSPHWFRHTYITHLLEQDVPLAVVKDLAGHADISTTNMYLERIQQDRLHEHTKHISFGM